MITYTVTALLAIAAAEIGYKEKETNAQLDDKATNAGDNNWTKYARDLHAAGYYQANKNGYAWCDMFVDWCFLQLAGGNADKAQEIICQTGPYGAGCSWSAKYYKQQDRFFTSDPQPGDQIFFSNYAHTGIVEKVEGGKVYTIEGNTSNMVARRTYTLGSSKIDGYGRPRYDEESMETPTAPSVLTGEVSTYNKDFLKKMFDHLKNLGYSAAGIYGMLGNANGESACKSDNLQNTGNTKLGMTDAEYTKAVDNGSYQYFCTDRHGYGLFQWTYPSRKEELLDYAQSGKNSIGDWSMQLNFTDMELKSGYKALRTLLRTTTDIKEASDAFMTQFERPADQSEAAKERRYKYALAIKELLEDTAEQPVEAPDTQASEIDIGAVVKITGMKYYGGQNIPEWVKAKNWVVHSLSGDRVVVNKSEDGKHAIMSPVNINDLALVSGPAAEWVPKVGDIVMYEGTTHYVSANASRAAKCKGGKAKITAIHQLGKSKHPYHLIRVSGGGATVYGWVDENTFKKI